MIGKLHSIFSEAGRGGDDSTIPGYGNPATSRVVKDYLAAMRVEQLEARIVPTQADPFFISDAAAIAAFIGKRVNESDLSANQPFKLIRDQAFLKTLFFAGGSKWSWKGQDSRTVALPQKRRPTIQSRANEKPSWWNFQLVFPKRLQERPATLPGYSSPTLYGDN